MLACPNFSSYFTRFPALQPLLPASAIYRVITWNAALFHQFWWATGLPRLCGPLFSLSLVLDLSLLLLQRSSAVGPLRDITHITNLQSNEPPLFIEWGNHRNRVEASLPEIKSIIFLPVLAEMHIALIAFVN